MTPRDPNTPVSARPSVQQSSNSARNIFKRQPLSCLPCRQHKLRCDRVIPCGTCVRHGREERCRQNPAPRTRTRPQMYVSQPQTDAPHTSEAIDNVCKVAEAEEILQQASFMHNKQITLINDLVGGLGAGGEAWTSQRSPMQSSWYPQTQSQLWTWLDMTNQKSLWRHELTRAMPTRSQCDILLCYFVEHINWLFQTVHIPSFRREYGHFWDGKVDDLDLIWMSLMFSIISLSALYIPFDMIELVGISRSAIRPLAHRWHLASQQALNAGEAEAKPCLVQLQTFSVTQLYWYATNNIETPNSRLGQAVRNAQAINLHKDESPSSCLRDEMRHRIWWDLVDLDTYQSISLTETSVHSRPPDEPTEMSLNIFRARIFEILNRQLTLGGGTFLKTYENVKLLDKELLDLMANLPWYFQLNQNPQFPAAGYLFSQWQNHIIRTSVSTQRIRMYKPFLSSHGSEPWRNCAKAAEDALAVYKNLRLDTTPASRQKFFPQAYQIFLVAVTLAVLLLVERSQPFPDARQWLGNLATDLQDVENQGCSVPITVRGRKVLMKLLSMYDQRGQCTPGESESLVSDISIILGGEERTRAYLDRHTVTQVSETVNDQAVEPTSSTRISPPHPVGSDSRGELHNLTASGWRSGQGAEVRERSRGTTDEVMDLMFENGASVPEDQSIDDLANWDMTGILSDWLNIPTN